MTFKLIPSLLIFSILLLSFYKNKEVQKTEEPSLGNIEILDSTLKSNVRDFFESLIKDDSVDKKKPDLFISVSWKMNNKYLKTVLLELGSLEESKKNLPNNFFGYSKYENSYIVFWNSDEKLIKWDSQICNPILFNDKILKKNKGIRYVTHKNYWILNYNSDSVIVEKY